MYVNNGQKDIIISKWIRKDFHSRNSLIFSDTNSALNKFVIPNLLNAKTNVVYFDFGNNLSSIMLENIKIIKFDNDNTINFNPFKLLNIHTSDFFVEYLLMNNFDSVDDELKLAIKYFLLSIVKFLCFDANAKKNADNFNCLYDIAFKYKLTSNDYDNILDKEIFNILQTHPTYFFDYTKFKLLSKDIKDKAVELCLKEISELSKIEIKDNDEDLQFLLKEYHKLVVVPEQNLDCPQYCMYLLSCYLQSINVKEINDACENYDKLHIIIDNIPEKFMLRNIELRQLSYMYNNIVITMINKSILTYKNNQYILNCTLLGVDNILFLGNVDKETSLFFENFTQDRYKKRYNYLNKANALVLFNEVRRDAQGKIFFQCLPVIDEPYYEIDLDELPINNLAIIDRFLNNSDNKHRNTDFKF